MEELHISYISLPIHCTKSYTHAVAYVLLFIFWTHSVEFETKWKIHMRNTKKKKEEEKKQQSTIAAKNMGRKWQAAPKKGE